MIRDRSSQAIEWYESDDHPAMDTGDDVSKPMCCAAALIVVCYSQYEQFMALSRAIENRLLLPGYNRVQNGALLPGIACWLFAVHASLSCAVDDVRIRL